MTPPKEAENWGYREFSPGFSDIAGFPRFGSEKHDNELKFCWSLNNQAVNSSVVEGEILKDCWSVERASSI